MSRPAEERVHSAVCSGTGAFAVFLEVLQVCFAGKVTWPVGCESRATCTGAAMVIGYRQMHTAQVCECASQADPRCGCVYTCVIRVVCVDNLFLVEVRDFHVDSFVLLFFVEWGTDVIGGPLETDLNRILYSKSALAAEGMQTTTGNPDPGSRVLLIDPSVVRPHALERRGELQNHTKAWHALQTLGLSEITRGRVAQALFSAVDEFLEFREARQHP